MRFADNFVAIRVAVDVSQRMNFHASAETADATTSGAPGCQPVMPGNCGSNSKRRCFGKLPKLQAGNLCSPE